MNAATHHQSIRSRRAVLHTGGTVSVLLGLGMVAIPGSGAAAAGNSDEYTDEDTDGDGLADAVASEAGIGSADAKKALEGFIDATTDALANGDRVALPEFGVFSVSNRVQNSKGNGQTDDSIVDFDVCPAFGAALDLGPGNGDRRRTDAGSKCRSADVVIDADRIAADTHRDTEKGLSKADAKKALEGFIAVTTNALRKGDTVSLIGFGSFSISKRSARTGRNPQTGKEPTSATKSVVKFKAGAELSKSVN